MFPSWKGYNPEEDPPAIGASSPAHACAPIGWRVWMSSAQGLRSSVVNACLNTT